MTVSVECEGNQGSCKKQFTADTYTNAIALLQLHMENIHKSPAAAITKQKAPKIERPTLRRSISAEEYSIWLKRYELWKKNTALATEEIPGQLLACCEQELNNAVLQYHSDIADSTVNEEELLKRIKAIAVLEVAATVRINDLYETTQGHGEGARAFCARLRSKAETCPFEVTCSATSCEQKTSYRDDIVRHQLLKGLASQEIKREVLGSPDIDTKSLSETVGVIEAKERAARATGQADQMAAMSAYKKDLKAPKVEDAIPAGTISCASCRARTPRYGKNKHGQLRELKWCSECFKTKRKPPPRPKPGIHAAAVVEDKAIFDGVDFLGSITEVRQGSSVSSEFSGKTQNSIKKGNVQQSHAPGQAPLNHALGQAPLNHALGHTHPPDTDPHASNVAHDTVSFSGCISTGLDSSPVDNLLYDDKRGWHAGDSKPHPRITLTAVTDHTAYHMINRNAPVSKPVTAVWVSDTGAMSCLGHPSLAVNMGITPEQLVSVKRVIRTANHGNVRVDGAIFIKLSATGSDGNTYEARVMTYLSPEVDNLYLSRHAQIQLGIIPESYPRVGAAAAPIEAAPVHAAPTDRAPCGCPKRVSPPGLPESLPFEATSENTARMREWLIDRYSASTFNKCPHQPLPDMKGPPMKVHIAENATPYVTRRPTKVPIHWRDEVVKQLEQDIALGVLERVPPGVADTWLHNMVITGKGTDKDGKDLGPRRTIDLQPLNKHATRETHHVVPPAQQVRRIPKDQVMTCFDAWNGYHSIPIANEDKDKFTFITEIGRLRYCRAPQGFTGSGDAFTHRYDMIVASVERLLKVVDDSLLYDKKSERGDHWWRVIKYLELCGTNGVVLNPEKFQFAAEQVDFTAFRITGSEVTPLPKYQEAIRSFPKPKNITDVRAWFGLVNQVAHYGRMVEIMEPFKPLLSPKTKFQWSEELDEAFERSKSAILDAIKKGVQIFEPNRRMCLQTDYSGTGLGYWLKQKYCTCPSQLPDCQCPEGWRVILAGSRFLKDAEKRYAPIEGEALGVAWALENTKWFTLGCKTLSVATDHKPLLKILGDKQLDEIHNHRLFRLKERTLMWTFSIHYVAGKTNYAADTTSRYPALDPEEDSMEAEIVATMQAHAETSGAISWAEVRQASAADISTQQLIQLIETGFPECKNPHPGVLPLLQYKDKLSVVDGVIMLEGRMIIPKPLRHRILQALHAAHQGISAMQNRARQCVYWPGISADIVRTRAECLPCDVNAPSNARMPPTDPMVPEYPFQAIVLDYFTLRGTKYLITVDRFSGWPHLARAKYSHEAVGSSGLCRTLRFIFATFGVPEEATSDGGPEFTADETEAFLKRWDVIHRLSAPYNSEGNGRAEVGVKCMKRLLADNIRDDGSLDTDRVVSGLLQFRNTPDPATGLSPAMVLFGRPLRDAIPIPPGTSIFSNPAVSPFWKQTWRTRETALGVKFEAQTNKLHDHSRSLGVLKPRDQVRVQNLCGPHPKKWDRTGQVLEHLPHDQYLVKMHGSGRILRRNRRHLRRSVSVPPMHQLLATPGSKGSPEVPPPRVDPAASADASTPFDHPSNLRHENGIRDTPPSKVWENSPHTPSPSRKSVASSDPLVEPPSSPPPSPPVYPPPPPIPALLDPPPSFDTTPPIGGPLDNDILLGNSEKSLADPPLSVSRPRRVNAGALPHKFKDYNVELPKLA